MEITTTEIQAICDTVGQFLLERFQQYRHWTPQETIEYIKALQGLDLTPAMFEMALKAASK